MNSVDLRLEWEAARAGLAPQDREGLIGMGVLAHDVGQMVGSVNISLCDGGFYEPDTQGGCCLITPVRVHTALTPESTSPDVYCRLGAIIDLVAWHPARPRRWALRAGIAEWLGCVEPQYLDPAAVPIWRSPLAWLQAECTGLVLLLDEALSRYRVLSWCVCGILAEDGQHVTELRESLEWPFGAPPVSVGRNTRRAA
jgi:hypothetical protein